MEKGQNTESREENRHWRGAQQETTQENKEDLPEACGKAKECGVMETKATESSNKRGVSCVKCCRETTEEED